MSQEKLEELANKGIFDLINKKIFKILMAELNLFIKLSAGMSVLTASFNSQNKILLFNKISCIFFFRFWPFVGVIRMKQQNINIFFIIDVETC